MIRQYKLRFYNFKLVALLLAISLFGVQLVASASPDLRNKQLLGVVTGVVILIILSLMDYSWILNFQWIMYGFNLLMLIGVRLFGSEAGGASRWLDIGGFRFQPTELSKIIIILFFAKFFMDHEDDINTFKILAESAILLAVPLALIYAQPDMKKYHYCNGDLLYFAVCGGLKLQDYRRGNPDRGAAGSYFPFHSGAAGSDSNQELSERPYHVFLIPGERGISGRY